MLLILDKRPFFEMVEEITFSHLKDEKEIIHYRKKSNNPIIKNPVHIENNKSSIWLTIDENPKIEDYVLFDLGAKYGKFKTLDNINVWKNIL